MAKIKEDVIDENQEIGGLLQLRPPIDATLKYKVTDVTGVTTEYGTRWDYNIQDDLGEWILSSWAFVSKKKFKPKDIIGLTIILKPYNEKKFLLEF